MNLAIFFDTETTGLPDWKSPSEAEHQPHIVQLAAHVVNLDAKEILESMDVIIKPDGWVIPEEVSAIHGITTERALAEGIPESEALLKFLLMWDGKLRIAHNTTFDNRIIRIATKRYCDESIINDWHEGPYECTGLITKPICQLLPKNKYGFKMPKLSEAYLHFTGKELENAHTALADVNACMEVYFAAKATQAEAA
jgi:DNA polymerase III subunit epsilon